MSKKTVLLIDDDRELAEGLALRIRGAFDVDTVCAHDPLHALDRLQHVTPELVICDVKMPTGNGLGICELMDQDQRWSGIPTVVLTGCSDGHTLRRVANLCAHYVHKSGDFWPRLKCSMVELAHFAPAALVPESHHTQTLRP